MTVDELILRLTELRKECENVEVFFWVEDGENKYQIAEVCFPEKEYGLSEEDLDKNQIGLIGEW